MKYFTTVDFNWLMDMNQRGLPVPGGTTSLWVSVVKHPLRDEWAACIPEDYIYRIDEYLTPEEHSEVVGGLKTIEQMESDGWDIPYE